MKLKPLVKLITLVLIISFISLYLTTVGGYYENNLSKQNRLTEEAIQRFEDDVKAGKKIIASNYIEEEKNYGNKATKIAAKLSNLVSKTNLGTDEGTDFKVCLHTFQVTQEKSVENVIWNVILNKDIFSQRKRK